MKWLSAIVLTMVLISLAELHGDRGAGLGLLGGYVLCRYTMWACATAPDSGAEHKRYRRWIAKGEAATAKLAERKRGKAARLERRARELEGK